MKKLFNKSHGGLRIALCILTLFGLSVLACTVYAVTLDKSDNIPIAASISGSSVGAVPEEAENAGYTRSMKINGFTRNGLSGNNYFYLAGENGADMSFYYGDSVVTSVKKDFNITVDNSFYITPDCDTIRIAEPKRGKYPTKYSGVTVTAGGVNVTSQLTIDYYSNFSDYATQTDSYVEISGLKDVTGDIEISGNWYPLDCNAYFSVEGVSGMDVSVAGKDNGSRFEDVTSYSFNTTKTVQHWIVYGGTYEITATPSDDTYKLEKIVYTDTDINDQERESVFYPDGRGVVTLTTPTPNVKPNTSQYVKFYFIEKTQAELGGYTRKVSINIGRTEPGGDYRVMFSEQSAVDFWSDSYRYVNSYNSYRGSEGSNSNIYLKPTQDTIRIKDITNIPDNTEYELVFKDENGDIISGITTEPMENGIIINGLSNAPGDIYITGWGYHKTQSLRIGNDNCIQGNILITANDDEGNINNQDSFVYDVASTNNYSATFKFGAGYTATFNNGNQRLKKAELSYDHYETGERTTVEFFADENGTINLDLPKIHQKRSGSYGIYLRFEAENIVPLHEAQVLYKGITGINYDSRNGRGQIKLTAKDQNGDPTDNILFNQRRYGVYSWLTNKISSKVFDGSTHLEEGAYYHIFSGTEMTVKDVWNTYADAGEDEDWKEFARDRFELTDVKVYKVEQFVHSHRAFGDRYTEGASTPVFVENNGVIEEVEVTKNNDGTYSFIMPDCPVRIQPVYTDHIRSVNIIANDNKSLNGNSDFGTASFSGDLENNKSYFVGISKCREGNVTSWSSDSNTSTEWSANYPCIVDGRTYSLTAVPQLPEHYYVSRIQVYKSYPLLSNPTSWVDFYNRLQVPGNFSILDSKGNIKADYPDVTDQFEITQLTEADPDTGETTFNITFPDELDFGNVIIMVYFEQKPSAYAHFAYQPDSTQGEFNPDAAIRGQIKDNITGLITVNGNTNVEMAIYEEDAPIYSTVELGGSGANSFFHEANLVYTLKDYTDDTELLKFRIYRGQILPAGEYTAEDMARYMDTTNSLVEKYGDGHGGLKERAVLKFKLPESGLRLTYSAEPTYIPVTVKQYKLNNNGQQSNADNTFSADISKNTTGRSGRFVDKYFAADKTLTTSYGLGSAEAEAFTDQYSVTGASETHYMYYNNVSGGLYLYPNPASGYTVAAIRARAKGFPGNTYPAADFTQNLTQVPVTYDENNGYAITYQANSLHYLQSAQIEIEVYYTPATLLTIKQHIDGEPEAGTLAEVTLNNLNAAAPVSPYSAFIDRDSKRFLDSVELIDTKNNVVEYDENIPGALSRTTKLSVNKGVQPSITIKPHGARNISSVKITKKNGNAYQTVDPSGYTVSGTLSTDGFVTYTFNNNINIGDDYIVDIVYGVEKRLTVKSVIIDGKGNTVDVDTEELFNESKATISVTGERYDIDGNAVAGEFAFTDRTVDPYVNKNSFTVTYDPATVTTATNTRLTVNTSIGSGSQYVIANVKAVKDSGEDLHLAVPKTVTQGDNEVGPTYENCTLSSLASTDNVTVIVYLAKVVRYNVSVFNIGATGNVNPGVPAGSDAYVDVNVQNGVINDKAIITDKTEGGYYTSSFDITSDPNTRSVNILQGSKIEIFAQLPGNGEYVVKKITSNGTGYGDVTVSNISFVGENLRVTLNTGQEAVSSDKTYDIDIYIEHAQSIFTRAVDVNGSNVSAATGSVTVNGSHSEAGVIPFTKIHPAAGSAESTHKYNAVNSGTGYTTEAKCVRGTDITFEIKPQSLYSVKTLTVKKGAVKESAADVSFALTGTAEDGTQYYKINESMPSGNNIFIDVEFEPDPEMITVYNKITGFGSGNISGYLFYVDDPYDIDFIEGADNYDKLGSLTRFGADLKSKTSVYYVLSTNLSREVLQLLSARYSEVSAADDGTDILAELYSSYTTRYNEKGELRYIYYYRVNPSDAHPVDNDIWFNVAVNQIVPDAGNEDPDCSITVEQWNRETYDGQYVAADNQSARFSVPNGKVLRRNNKNGAAANPITVSSSMGYMYSEKKTTMTITPLPAEGYNVEKVVIYHNGVNQTLSGSNGVYHYSLSKDPTTIKIYYSRPMLIISSTNEGNQGKATVDVNNEPVLNQNTFISGVFVIKNEESNVLIRPMTYDDNGVSKYYKVSSIRIGDAFNNTLTVYTDTAGDVDNDLYTVTKNASGSEYTLKLNNVQKDKYIFIQLVGKEKIYQSNVQINQQIRFAGSEEYVDCGDGSFGSVTLSGVLAGKENPLNFGEDVSSYTLNDAASALGTVLKDTSMSIKATAPSGYTVQSVEAEMNGEGVTVSKTSGGYSIVNKAPDSGTTVITVKYAIETTRYTLTYNYQGRRGGNEESYIGDDSEYDNKTYSVNVDLTASELDGGKPSAKTLAKYAPAVNDLYKDCEWIIDDAHVEYDTENSTVTVTAKHTPKKCTVEFVYGGQTLTVDQVALNSLVQPEGEFVTAPESDGTNDFAYWSVTENGQETAKCYDREFMLRITGDCTVTACYGAVANAVTISDPAYSREQTTDANGKNVDMLYADFILAYMEKNGKLLNPAYENHTDDDYQTGLIVEYDTNIKLEKADESGAKLSEQEKVVYPDGDVLSAADAKTLANGGTLSNTDHRYICYSVANDKYNNHNRVDRAISFVNSEAARHMVLRAYYYVWNKTTGTFEMTDPVYFYLYDIGNSVSSSQ